jgi:ribosomal protein S18 acetylase RimI-like enzyme
MHSGVMASNLLGTEEQPGFRVQPLEARHFAACAQLMGRSDPWVTLGITEGQALAGMMSQACPAVGAVAPDSGRVLGFVRYETRGFIGYHAYIRTVAVDPAVRGQRVGEALVKHVESLVFSQVPMVFLFCSSFNTRGQAFYQRLGYARVGEVPAFSVPAHGEILYFKRRPEDAPVAARTGPPA